MELLRIENKTISTPLLDIIKDIKRQLHNGKLASIRVVGKNIKLNCPSHDNGLEKNADAYVYIGENTKNVHYGDFHCFACGEVGPFYHFVAECFDQDDEWGKQWLLENYSDGIVEFQLDMPELDLGFEDKRLKPIDDSILDTFQDYHPYMTQRKLSADVIKRFRIKYDPKTESIVFPVWNNQNKLVMLTRRSVVNKKFIIDTDKEKPVYLLNDIINNNIDKAIITEAQIDALTARSYGFPAIATMGSISDIQIKELNKSPIRVYYTMFDNDEAGRKFTYEFKRKIRKDVIVVTCRIPNGKKDINDLTKEEFEYSLRTAR